MKLILYSLPNCKEVLKIKNFLQRNNIKFNEIILDSEEKKAELKKLTMQNKVSALKIVYNHSIHVISGFNEAYLNLNLLEHIKKYNPKIEK